MQGGLAGPSETASRLHAALNILRSVLRDEDAFESTIIKDGGRPFSVAGPNKLLLSLSEPGPGPPGTDRPQLPHVSLGGPFAQEASAAAIRLIAASYNPLEARYGKRASRLATRALACLLEAGLRGGASGKRSQQYAYRTRPSSDSLAGWPALDRGGALAQRCLQQAVMGPVPAGVHPIAVRASFRDSGALLGVTLGRIQDSLWGGLAGLRGAGEGGRAWARGLALEVLRGFLACVDAAPAEGGPPRCVMSVVGVGPGAGPLLAEGAPLRWLWGEREWGDGDLQEEQHDDGDDDEEEEEEEREAMVDAGSFSSAKIGKKMLEATRVSAAAAAACSERKIEHGSDREGDAGALHDGSHDADAALASALAGDWNDNDAVGEDGEEDGEEDGGEAAAGSWTAPPRPPLPPLWATRPVCSLERRVVVLDTPPPVVLPPTDARVRRRAGWAPVRVSPCGGWAMGPCMVLAVRESIDLVEAARGQLGEARLVVDVDPGNKGALHGGAWSGVVRERAQAVADRLEGALVERVTSAVLRCLGRGAQGNSPGDEMGGAKGSKAVPAPTCSSTGKEREGGRERGGLLLVQKRCSPLVARALASKGVLVLPRLSARFFGAVCSACGCVPHEDWRGLAATAAATASGAGAGESKLGGGAGAGESRLGGGGAAEGSGAGADATAGWLQCIAVRAPGLPGDVSVGEGRAVASAGRWTAVLRGGVQQGNSPGPVGGMHGPRGASLLVWEPTESSTGRAVRAAEEGRAALLGLLVRPHCIAVPACVMRAGSVGEWEAACCLLGAAALVPLWRGLRGQGRAPEAAAVCSLARSMGAGALHGSDEGSGRPSEARAAWEGARGGCLVARRAWGRAMGAGRAACSGCLGPEGSGDGVEGGGEVDAAASGDAEPKGSVPCVECVRSGVSLVPVHAVLEAVGSACSLASVLCRVDGEEVG